MINLFGQLIEESEEAKTVKSRYGFLPTSIWYCTKNSPAAQFICDDETGLIDNIKNNKGGTTRMSEFDPEVADRIIKYWSNEGDFIVDPFCGRATRAICSIYLRRNYQGYEISPKHFEFTKWRLEQLNKHRTLFSKEWGEWGKYELVLGDGVKLAKTDDNVADFIMTCPPYWNIEKYESVEGQLSDIDNYLEFEAKIAEHAKNAYRILKPGKFAVYIINA